MKFAKRAKIEKSKKSRKLPHVDSDTILIQCRFEFIFLSFTEHGPSIGAAHPGYLPRSADRRPMFSFT